MPRLTEAYRTIRSRLNGCYMDLRQLETFLAAVDKAEFNEASAKLTFPSHGSGEGWICSWQKELVVTVGHDYSFVEPT